MHEYSIKAAYMRVVTAYMQSGLRYKADFFAERNIFLSAKTEISCRKAVFGLLAGVEKRGFGWVFSSGRKAEACRSRLTDCRVGGGMADAAGDAMRKGGGA